VELRLGERRQLPELMEQSRTRRAYRFWEENPLASAPRFKKVRDVYSVRVGNIGYRAIAVDVPDRFLWIWIGPHDEYERLLRQ
jgi:hypothetical protein